MAPSRYDWKIVDWDVKPQYKQTNINFYLTYLPIKSFFTICLIRNQLSVDVLRFIIICQIKCSEVLSGYECSNARNQAMKCMRVYRFPIGSMLNMADKTSIQPWILE